MLTQSVLSGSILDEEIALEEEAIEQGIIRYRQLVRYAVERGDGAALKPAERLILHWIEPLIELIRAEQADLRAGVPGRDRTMYGPALLAVDAERLAVLTMREALSAGMLEPGGVKMATIAYAVGRAALGEAHHDYFKTHKEHAGVISEIERRYANPHARHYNHRAGKVLDSKLWDKPMSVKVGVALLWMMIQVATVGRWDEPFALAFHHERRFVRRGRVAFLRLDERALEIIESGHEVRQFMRPRYMPMIVRPYLWSEDVQGGYVRIRTPFISKPTGTQRKALQEADLSRVFRSIDDIAGTPWRVNQPVADVVRQVWERGGAPAGDPFGVPSASNIEIPPKPDDIETNEEARRAWRREASMAHEANVELRGARCEFLNKLAVADRMKGYEQFYYPHQLDFRGRCYPIPPHLNHQGDDVCRGMLECAHGVRLDARAKWWVRVHAANCYGHDKLPFQTRHDWTEESMSAIHRAVADPLRDEWWRQADKPWQFLAACFALVHEEYVAPHLPVQIDGTCNGLQHYAALGRDPQGAAVVNMTPGEWPSDIYSDVARIVQGRVQADLEAGDPFAAIVAPIIGRKVVKQPVMTSVYGVTMVGARQQVQARLIEAGLPKEGLYKVSAYLANVILDAIKELCVGAAEIMAWLRKCAAAICKTGEPVAWTTPLGLPVVQPYRKYHKRQVATIMQRVTLIIEDEVVPISPRRQADGVAPNFVHSIDATHMMMTASRCATSGVWFAGVHDSYWTHAAHTDRLAAILRDEFIKLHARPLLEDLAAEWHRRYPEAEIPDPPASGSYDLESVRGAQYFFN